MEKIDYKKMYALQDKVLDIIFKAEKEFYLTGGTCLNRFYQEKRYSDDLDFFTNNSPRYNFAVKNIKIALEEKFDLKVEVETKNFIRFKIDALLQLDFVNDISVRYKEPVVLDNGFIIDNIENILSNKITAIIGRDNPKDIFDIYLISKYYSFSWDDILYSAHKKANFAEEDLIVRLKTFPMELLKNINIIDANFLDNIADEFPIIINEINHKSYHEKERIEKNNET